MMNSEHLYDNFVPHPRYGRSPRFTGLNPDSKTGSTARLHRHSSKNCRIQNTAIVANLSHQNSSLGFVTHYFDTVKCCIDCDRKFIFFADEQRHWYEVLKIFIDAECLRCVECRKLVHGIEQLRQRYDRLLYDENRSESSCLELAECCITLIERSAFGPNAIQVARRSLNQIPADSKFRKHAKFLDLWARSSVLLKSGR